MSRIADFRRSRAFTLAEVMIAMSIGSFVLTGVLSTYVIIGKNCQNTANYVDLESSARAGLETFSREVRMAFNVTAYSATSVTLSIPDSTTPLPTLSYNVTYSYTLDTTTTPNTYNFTRTGPPISNPTGASTTTVLIRNVQQISGIDPFTYLSCISSNYTNGFARNNDGTPKNAATNTSSIKQIELNFTAQRNNTTVATSTNKVISACFILRNK